MYIRILMVQIEQSLELYWITEVNYTAKIGTSRQHNTYIQGNQKHGLIPYQLIFSIEYSNIISPKEAAGFRYTVKTPEE